MEDFKGYYFLLYANAIILPTIDDKNYEISKVHLTYVNLGIVATIGRQRNSNNGLICCLRNCYTIYVSYRLHCKMFGHYIPKQKDFL